MYLIRCTGEKFAEFHGWIFADKTESRQWCRPTLYRAETWKKAPEKKLVELAETRMLRMDARGGKQKLDSKINEIIRGTTKVREISKNVHRKLSGCSAEGNTTSVCRKKCDGNGNSEKEERKAYWLDSVKGLSWEEMYYGFT